MARIGDDMMMDRRDGFLTADDFFDMDVATFRRTAPTPPPTCHDRHTVGSMRKARVAIDRIIAQGTKNANGGGMGEN